MEKTNLRVRKWGNSFGVVLPRIISNQPVQEGMEIEVTIHPKNKTKVKDVFGVMKGRFKKPTDKLLKEVDKEFWGE